MEIKDIANEIRDARKHTNYILAHNKYKDLVMNLVKEISMIETELEDMVLTIKNQVSIEHHINKIAYQVGVIKGRLDE